MAAHASPILVTGATGNIGRHVATALLAARMPVRAADLSTATVAAALPGADPVRFDFTEPATWVAAFAGGAGDAPGPPAASGRRRQRHDPGPARSADRGHAAHRVALAAGG
ncbi:MAG: NAD-dependent epimerase/dehydratase family protein [Candidatus Nanopelagicales bacterium]